MSIKFCKKCILPSTKPDLEFDKNTWEIYKHSCHHENRLSDYDYVEIFNKCGFVAVVGELIFSEKKS